jgi:pantothenate synthetase
VKIKGVLKMAVQRDVEQQIELTKEAIKNAEDQLNAASRQESQTTEENYSQAQLQLEEALTEIEKLSLSANPEQKNQLDRTRQQLTQMQEQMVFKMK